MVRYSLRLKVARWKDVYKKNDGKEWDVPCWWVCRQGPRKEMLGNGEVGAGAGEWHVARGEWRVASGTGGSVVMVVPWESKEANTNTRHVTRFPISSFKIGPLLGFQQTIPVFTYLATIPV
jgi:hypothetical protein